MGLCTDGRYAAFWFFEKVQEIAETYLSFSICYSSDVTYGV